MAGNKPKLTVERVNFALIALFLPPYAIMLGVGTLGWHWSYWQSMLIDNAAWLPLGITLGGVLRAHHDWKADR